MDAYFCINGDVCGNGWMDVYGKRLKAIDVVNGEFDPLTVSEVGIDQPCNDNEFL